MSAFHLPERRLFALVCVAAAAYTVLASLLLGTAALAPPDALEYAVTARNLARGDGFTIHLVEIHPGLLPSVRHLHELHGLLQPLLLAPLFAVFGPRLHLYTLPCLAFVGGTFVASFALGRRVGGSAVGLLAGAFMTWGSRFAFAAALGSDDVGWTCFSTASLAAFFAAIETGRRRWMLTAGLLGALATLQKFPGSVLAGVYVAVIVVSPGLRRRWGLRGALAVTAPVVLAAVAYAVRNYLLHGGPGFRFGALDWLAKQDPLAYFAYYAEAPRLGSVLTELGFAGVVAVIGRQLGVLATVVLGHPLLGVGPIAVVLALREHRLFASTAAAYSVMVVGLTCLVYHVEVRYLFGLFPVYSVAVALLVVNGWRRIVAMPWVAAHPRVLGAAPALTTLLAAAAAIPPLLGYAELGRVPLRSDCADAIAFLRSSAGPDEPILTSSPWYVTWMTDRPSVMVPTNGSEATEIVARHYGAKWAIDGFRTTGTADVRAAVDSMYHSRTRLLPRLAFHGTCDVYRLRIARR